MENTIYDVTPTELRKIIKIGAKSKKAIFIWGPPGIGKSAIVNQVSQEDGFDNFSDIRLSTMANEDVRGVPFLDKNEDGRGEQRWGKPSFYHYPSSGRTLYFFDEMNTAPQSVQAAAYQAVLDRAVGDFKFGPEDYVVAAGNRESDRGVTYRMPTPLANRFTHVTLKVNFEDWKSHALNNRFHPAVMGYLSANSSHLHKFSPQEAQANLAFATPRSWEFLSDHFYAFDQVAKDMSINEQKSILRKLVSGTVGTEIVSGFMTHWEHGNSLPNPRDVLSGKVSQVGAEVTQNSGLCMHLTTTLLYELKTYSDRVMQENYDRDKYLAMLDNLIRFSLANFSDEITIATGRRITFKGNGYLSVGFGETPNLSKFRDRFKKVVIELTNDEKKNTGAENA